MLALAALLMVKGGIDSYFKYKISEEYRMLSFDLTQARDDLVREDVCREQIAKYHRAMTWMPTNTLLSLYFQLSCFAPNDMVFQHYMSLACVAQLGGAQSAQSVTEYWHKASHDAKSPEAQYLVLSAQYRHARKQLSDQAGREELDQRYLATLPEHATNYQQEFASIFRKLVRCREWLGNHNVVLGEDIVKDRVSKLLQRPADVALNSFNEIDRYSLALVSDDLLEREYQTLRSILLIVSSGAFKGQSFDAETRLNEAQRGFDALGIEAVAPSDMTRLDARDSENTSVDNQEGKSYQVIGMASTRSMIRKGLARPIQRQ